MFFSWSWYNCSQQDEKTQSLTWTDLAIAERYKTVAEESSVTIFVICNARVEEQELIIKSVSKYLQKDKGKAELISTNWQV